VERRADVQTHRQAVQPGHDHIFEADAFELIARAEHLRPDESGDVVDDRPGARALPDAASHAVRSSLERPHVHALGDAIGDLGDRAGDLRQLGISHPFASVAMVSLPRADA